MFTGLIEEKGRLKSIRHGQHSAVLEISAVKVLEGVSLGDSIAVNGVCLTVTSYGESAFCADAMPETLRRTSLGSLRPGDELNLERAMPASGRFGGHLVSGHVDCCGKVLSIVREDNARLVTVSVPDGIMRFIPEKGSVALNGASLTVCGVTDSSFTVSLIPHTMSVTTLGGLRPGDEVNVEVDQIARYVERLMSFSSPKGKGITMDFLIENGF